MRLFFVLKSPNIDKKYCTQIFKFFQRIIPKNSNFLELLGQNFNLIFSIYFFILEIIKLQNNIEKDNIERKKDNTIMCSEFYTFFWCL